MPNRNQNQGQDQQQKGRNPGTFSNDDDEANEADVTRAGEQDLLQKRRKAGQQDTDPVSDIEDEEAEDDEDDADGLGARP
jgi:hypothetical protein